MTSVFTMNEGTAICTAGLNMTRLSAQTICHSHTGRGFISRVKSLRLDEGILHHKCRLKCSKQVSWRFRAGIDLSLWRWLAWAVFPPGGQAPATENLSHPKLWGLPGSLGHLSHRVGRPVQYPPSPVKKEPEAWEGDCRPQVPGGSTRCGDLDIQ